MGSQNDLLRVCQYLQFSISKNIKQVMAFRKTLTAGSSSGAQRQYNTKRRLNLLDFAAQLGNITTVCRKLKFRVSYHRSSLRQRRRIIRQITL